MNFLIFFTLITIACANQRYNFGHQNDLSLINNNHAGLGYGPMLYNQNGYTMNFNNLDSNTRNHLYRNQINDDQVLNNGYNFVISGSHLDRHGLKNSLVLGGNAYTFSDNLAYNMKMPALNMYNDDLLKNSYRVQYINKEPLHTGLRLNSGFNTGIEKYSGNNVYLPMPAIQAIPPPRNPVVVENIVQQKLVSANLPVARVPVIRRVFRAPVQTHLAQPQIIKTQNVEDPIVQAPMADSTMFESPVIQPAVKYANDRVLMKPFVNMQHNNYLQPHETYERIEPQVNSYSTKINHVVPMKKKNHDLKF